MFLHVCLSHGVLTFSYFYAVTKNQGWDNQDSPWEQKFVAIALPSKKSGLGLDALAFSHL